MPGRSVSTGSHTLEKFTESRKKHSPPVNKSGSNLPDLKERDTETGLDYFGARYYDPSLGKWYAVDPLGDKYLDMSPYNYCGNEPISKYDPNGKFIGTIIGTIVGATTGAINAYVNNKDVFAGATEGAISGCVAGALVDATIATGGSAILVVGAAVGGWALGAGAGDVAGQVITNADAGMSLKEAVQKIDLNQTESKMETGAVTGLIGGSVAAGTQALGNSVAAAADDLTSSTKDVLKVVSNTTGYGSKGAQEVAQTIGQTAKKITDATLKIEAGAAVTTTATLDAAQNATNNKIERDRKKN